MAQQATRPAALNAVVPIIPTDAAPPPLAPGQNHPCRRAVESSGAAGRDSESLIFNPDPTRLRTLVGFAQMTPRRIRMTALQPHRPTCMARCHLEAVGIDWWDLQRLRFQLATRPWFCWGADERSRRWQSAFVNHAHVTPPRPSCREALSLGLPHSTMLPVDDGESCRRTRRPGALALASIGFRFRPRDATSPVLALAGSCLFMRVPLLVGQTGSATAFPGSEQPNAAVQTCQSQPAEPGATAIEVRPVSDHGSTAAHSTQGRCRATLHGDSAGGLRRLAKGRRDARSGGPCGPN